MGDDILDDISKEMFWHSVAFVKIQRQEGKEIPRLRGSGVLVQRGTYFGILTAAHVAAELDRLDFIGMIYSEEPIQITYKRDVFRIDRIMYKEDNPQGPDLAIITPPIKVLDDLKSKKSFVNLSKRQVPIEDISVKPLVSQWGVMGAVQELSANEGPNQDLRAMLMCYYCGEPIFNARNDHDLFELHAEYSKDTDTPISFKGVSGGGLWRAVLDIQEGEERIRDHAKLMGIAFYQEDLKDDARIIRGHGPASVYDMVPNFLNRMGI